MHWRTDGVGRQVLDCSYFYTLFSLPLGTCMKREHNRHLCQGDNCPDYENEDEGFRLHLGELFGKKGGDNGNEKGKG